MDSLVTRLRLVEANSIADLDHPSTVEVHRRIIQSKVILRKVYEYFYTQVKRNLAAQHNRIVELGSGAGFLKEFIPTLTTSDVVPIQGVNLCFSAEKMPFKGQEVDAFVMVDVFHHIPDTKGFLAEVERCLGPGGRLVMVEPANTPWARFIFQNFHHEAFEPKADWGLTSSGPLSSANGALPWIVFDRDRLRFEKTYPTLIIKSVVYHSPIKYLVSGGLTFKQLCPSFFFPLITLVEDILSPFSRVFGMFMTITIEKR